MLPLTASELPAGAGPLPLTVSEGSIPTVALKEGDKLFRYPQTVFFHEAEVLPRRMQNVVFGIAQVDEKPVGKLFTRKQSQFKGR